jgi:peroxiredoxin
MGRWVLGLLLLATPVPGAAQDERKDPPVKVDGAVRDFRLRDLMKDGESFVSLSDFKGKKTTALIFTSYNCDACLDYEKRILKLLADFKGKDVVFLGVRSSAEDTPEGMRKYAEEKKFGIPVLDDPENAMANHFRVIITPTFCVIDAKGTLRYRGAYDENIRPERALKKYMHDALDAVLGGKEVGCKETKAVGCHMPRVEDEQK